MFDIFKYRTRVVNKIRKVGRYSVKWLKNKYSKFELSTNMIVRSDKYYGTVKLSQDLFRMVVSYIPDFIIHWEVGVIRYCNNSGLVSFLNTHIELIERLEINRPWNLIRNNSSRWTNRLHFTYVKCIDGPVICEGDMGYLFRHCTFLETITGEWNTSKVTDMSGMFYGARNFNSAIEFDTSQVTDMSNMFDKAKKFNQPLNFDTSKVEDMSNMFREAIHFNQPLKFDTVNVTNMSSMFQGTASFNQPLNFDTRNVTDMCGMFMSAINFNSTLQFDTSKVEIMSCMFEGAEKFNQQLNFYTNKVTNMFYMLYGAEKFNQNIDFDISNVVYIDPITRDMVTNRSRVNISTI